MQRWTEQEMGEEILVGIVSLQAPCVNIVLKKSIGEIVQLFSQSYGSNC
jgi:hypothetical protein